MSGLHRMRRRRWVWLPALLAACLWPSGVAGEPMVLVLSGPSPPVCACTEVTVYLAACDTDPCSPGMEWDLIRITTQADGWHASPLTTSNGCYYQTFRKTFNSAGSATVSATATDLDVCRSEWDGTLSASLTVTAVDKWDPAPGISFGGIASPANGSFVRGSAEVTCTAAAAADNDSKNCNPVTLEPDGCTYTWHATGGVFKNNANTGQTVTWVTPQTYSVPITISVTVDDHANIPAGDCGSRNDAPVSSSVQVRIDSSSPQPSFGAGGGVGPAVQIGANTYVPASFTVTTNASDDNGVASVTCTPPGETRTYSGCSQKNVQATFNVTNQPDGPLTITASAADCAGNQATTTKNVIVDGTAPTSAVQALPPTVSTTSFVVSWSGQDNTGGVGLKDYDVQYRDGSGSWTGWRSATTQTSGTFTGQIGHTYYFRSRARDKLDNLEAYPTGDGDTHTAVVPGGVDLDIDSDNNDGTETPGRTTTEEAIEDIFGSDFNPGKLVLVGDSDSDRDGIPDYADGFDLNPLSGADDVSSDAFFVPIVLEVSQSTDLSSARLVLTYDASVPAAVTLTMDDPYVLPAGRLRIWKKNGYEARSKASAHLGGDFVATDTTYTPQDLGLSDSQRTVVLYLESTKESLLTADLPITVTLYPTGQVGSPLQYSDTVRVTSVKMEILARASAEEEYSEVGGFVATSLPEKDAPVETGYPAAFQSYRVKVYDPRACFSSINMNGQAVPMTRLGGVYTSDAFLGIVPGERPVLERDLPYELTVTRYPQENHTYNANVLPSSANADPAAWTVTDNGTPATVSVSNGTLDIDSMASLNLAYWAGITASGLWRPAENTTIEVRFKMLDWDSQAYGGALQFRFGGNQRHWLVGLRADKLVYHSGGLATSLPYPTEIGNDGNLIDGNFHTLRISFENDGDLEATAQIIDGDSAVWQCTVSSDPGEEYGIWWGDPDEGVAGHVQIDRVSWIVTDTDNPITETIYSIRPSDVVTGNAVLDFAGEQLGASYNPSRLNPFTWFRKEADPDKVIGTLVVNEAESLRQSNWDHVAAGYAAGDDGAFGKEVHRRVVAKLGARGEKWTCNVVVQNGTNRIIAIGSETGWSGCTQIDAIALKGSYRPRVGEILDRTKITVYEIRTAIDGGISDYQLQKLKAVMNGGRVNLIRSKCAYKVSTRSFIDNPRVTQALRILCVVGMINAACNTVHADDFEDDWQSVVKAMDDAKTAESPEARDVLAIQAVLAVRNYLSNFIDDPSGSLDLVTVGAIHKILRGHGSIAPW